MNTRQIAELISSTPGLSRWPELVDLFPNQDKPLRMDWRLPGFAYEAVGGAGDDLRPLAAALAVLQVSIILVDDILDDEPDGVFRTMGAGRTANLALALQAAASDLVHRSEMDLARRALIAASLQRMALNTAVGQEVDVQGVADEARYWQLVEAKSTPFYATALEIGAIAGQATPKMTQGIRRYGALLGECIQIMDDLLDAFETPAKPDWQRPGNNLCILFARTTNHAQKERFEFLLQDVTADDHLVEAQQILISSNGVGYCLYHLAQRYASVRHLLAELKVSQSKILEDLYSGHLQPVRNLLEGLGVPVPRELGGK